MYIGADYYPEHWPEKRWEQDARLMKEAGFNVVRLAEFAWNKLEPKEGSFEFAWLDKALKTLNKRGIKAILGTPTATMPSWCAAKYAETRAVRLDGEREPFGVRKDNCFSSPVYRELSRKITAAMAKRYARHAGVIGWQTDNEFSGPYCYCEFCRAEFQAWLKSKYKTLKALNAAWGTFFWAHEYFDWQHIPLAMRPGGDNPGLALDHKRFHSWLNVRFQADQVKILRKLCGRKQFITHNFMGMHRTLDYYDLARDLDHVSYDNYPIWDEPGVTYESAISADQMRGLKGKNYWIMEQTSGPGGWMAMGRNPRPGEIRRVFYQQIARGADHFLWFRWRVCRHGTEQYWHGIIGHDGVPARRYRECAATAKECHGIAKELAGTSLKSSVAMLMDYDTCWALDTQPSFRDNDYIDQLRRYHRALVRAGVNCDLVSTAANLKSYKVVIAPELFVLPDATAKRLVDFVRSGGVLLTDLRTGVKDADNACHERVLPGLLRQVLKIRIEEYESLSGGDVAIVGGKELAGKFTGHIGCEWVIAEKAEVLASYATAYLKDYAAVTRAKLGKGTAIYCGTVAREEAFYDKLVALALKQAGVKPLCELPQGVEMTMREKKGSRLLFFINHSGETREVMLPDKLKAKALIGPEPEEGLLLTLPPEGVAVLKV